MPAETATSPRLMTEIERQQHYLRQLPPDYEFPLFSGRQAVESQRRLSTLRQPAERVGTRDTHPPRLRLGRRVH